LIFGVVALLSQRAVADEGGVSFWLPGTYGSLAAVPAVPGWSFAAFNYYESVSASKGADFVRGGGIVAGVNSRIDFLFVNPAYVFATPVLGGQATARHGRADRAQHDVGLRKRGWSWRQHNFGQPKRYRVPGR
jgi:hypothetical protein